jgi:hypothetical protein
MIRIKEIQDALRGVVGWEQSFSPDVRIDDELTESESGLYFQGAHPLVTLDNVRAIIPDIAVEQYPEWRLIIVYKVGDRVRHNGVVYVALRENQNVEPPAHDFNSDYNHDYGGDTWKPYDLLNDYLRRLEDNVIAQTVQTFLQVKSLLRESKNLLERRTFFDGAGRINATLQNGQRLVGFEITPAYSMGVTAKIERVGLQMTGATGTVRLYLFHSSQVDPIKTADLEFTKENGGFQWFTMSDWYMPYVSDNTDSGGAWYLCYNQADLPDGMEAINVSKDWSREPCGTCNRGNIEAWRELTKYINIAPFKVPALETFEEYPEMWDIERNIYTSTTNYGLNVEVSVGCDLTDFIIEQRQIFSTVIQRQMAATVLRTLALNPHVRVNRNQSNASKNELLYEVDGNTEGRATGIGYELRKAYEALDLDTRGIDRICLTCRPVGARYRTV